MCTFFVRQLYCKKLYKKKKSIVATAHHIRYIVLGIESGATSSLGEPRAAMAVLKYSEQVMRNC